MASIQNINGTKVPPNISLSLTSLTSEQLPSAADLKYFEVEALPLDILPVFLERLTAVLNKNTDMTTKEKAELLRKKAQCNLKLGDHDAALVDAQAALSEDPQELGASIAGGQAAASLGRYKEAFHLYKAGLVVEPENKMIAEQLRGLQSSILEQSEGAEEEPSYNALDFSSLDPYPGDDMQLLMERDILNKKYLISNNLMDTTGKTANTSEAIRYLKRADEALDTGRYGEAVSLCTRALDADPTNLAARQYRANLHFGRGDMLDALKDCWAIAKANRTSDIWKMGGKVLISLGLPVTAEFWLRKATLVSGKQDKEANILFQKVRVKRLFDPLTKDFPIAVDFLQYGRALIAKRDIKAGEILLKDIPLIHAQTLASRYVPACCHCTCSLISAKDYFGDNYEKLSAHAKIVVARHWPETTPIWCPRCSREMYCSTQCMEAAWENNHRILCPSVNKAAEKLFDLRDHDGYGYNEQGRWVELWGGHYSPFVLAKMWATMLAQVRQLMLAEGNLGGQPTMDQWARVKAPFRRFIAFGTTSATERMPEMLKIFCEVFTNCEDNLTYPISDAEFKGRYYQAACNLQCYSAYITPFQKFLTSLQTDLDGLELLVHLDEKKVPVAYFAGLFPVHACINHSCINNAEVTDGELDGNFGIQIIAKQDIKQNEEVFSTYIDTALPRVLRRAWLFKSFNFWCHCQRCQFEGDKPTVCTQCGVKAKNKQFPTCGKCYKAWYCSTKCQRKAWVEGHKMICQTQHSVVSSPRDYEVC